MKSFAHMAAVLVTLIAIVSAQGYNSTDPTQECTPYSTQFTFTGYPPVWVTATTNVLNTTEFQSVFNSINWAVVPNIPPKTFTNGSPNTAGYNASDPDCWWSFQQCVHPKAAGVQPDIFTCPEAGTWGLTYDDGPNCSHNAFYDYLISQNNQKATLFFIGSNVADWPYQAQRGYTDGHQIAVHTWSHQPMTTLSNQAVVAELYYTKKVIQYIVGVTPIHWRPPYGDVDDRVRMIAQQLNLTTVIWDLDTNDFDVAPFGPTPKAQIDANFQAFVNMGMNGTFANSGTIVLEHELNNGTMAEAIQWLPSIQQAFKHVVPVATCMNVSHPYTEQNITYPTFSQMTGMGNSSNGGGNSTSGGNGTTGTTTGHNGSSAPVPSVGLLVLLSLVALFF